MALKDWKPRKWTKLFMSRQLRKETPPYYQNLKIGETIEVYRMPSRRKKKCKTWVVNITNHNTKKFGSKRAALKYVKSYMIKSPKKMEKTDIEEFKGWLDFQNPFFFKGLTIIEIVRLYKKCMKQEVEAIEELKEFNPDRI